jgi:prepilin-type N-terminal cleavage/methylation domain-containing protein
MFTRNKMVTILERLWRTNMNIKNNKGFSLIELMIAVVIIGVLAAIAIPQYQQYIRKARQSEAKNTLGGIFTSEKTYVNEFGAAVSSLLAIGYAPEGGINYDCGWVPASGTRAPLDNNNYPVPANLAMSNTITFCPIQANATCRVAQPFGAAAALANAAPAAGSVQFTARCNGRIGGVLDDAWTINQGQQVLQVTNGVL